MHDVAIDGVAMPMHGMAAVSGTIASGVHTARRMGSMPGILNLSSSSQHTHTQQVSSEGASSPWFERSAALLFA
eukprot:scaffold30145_cov19-Tisochrysis_lutea.AAC.2